MGFTLTLDAAGIIGRPLLSPPPNDAHKYSRGSAMVISGPVLRTGASRLTAQAALAVGAGLVTILGHRDSLTEHAAHVTAIMLREADKAFSVVDDRVHALAVGPGVGVSDGLVEDVATLLLRKIPIVLDADALTVFEAKPEMLFAMLHEHAVLTPHEGEFCAAVFRHFACRSQRGYSASRKTVRSDCIAQRAGHRDCRTRWPDRNQSPHRAVASNRRFGRCVDRHDLRLARTRQRAV